MQTQSQRRFHSVSSTVMSHQRKACLTQKQKEGKRYGQNLFHNSNIRKLQKYVLQVYKDYYHNFSLLKIPFFCSEASKALSE